MSSESLPAPPSSLNGRRRRRPGPGPGPVAIASAPRPTPKRTPATPHGAERTAHLTDDLFLGAYLVAEGASLTGTELQPRPGRGEIVSFVIEAAADELAVLESAYARGEALTNVLRFKSALTHLKDVMFARLREVRRAAVAETELGDARR